MTPNTVRPNRSLPCWTSIIAFVASAVLLSSVARAEPPKVSTVTTPGGHEVHIATLPDAPYSQILFAWPNAVALNLPGKEGVYTLGPTLPFEKAGEWDLLAIKEEMEDRKQGIVLANTFDATNMVVMASKGSSFEPATGIAADILKRPALAPDDLARLQRDMSDNLKANDHDPGFMLQRALGAFIAGDDRRLAVLTNQPASTFESVTVDDIRDWMSKVLTSGPQVFAAGPASEDEIAAAVDTVLADLPVADGPAKPAEPVQIERQGQTLAVKVRDAPVALITFAMEGPRESWGRGAAFHTLVGTSDSRLFKSLRSMMGATYGFQRGDIMLPAGRQITTLGGAVAPDRAAEVVKAVREEMERLRTQGITQVEFEAYREFFRPRETGRTADPDAVTGNMRDSVQAGLEIDIARIGRELEGLTLQAVDNEIAEVLPERMTAVVLTNDLAGVEANCTVETPEEATNCPK